MRLLAILAALTVAAGAPPPAESTAAPSLELTGAWRWDGPTRGTLQLELTNRLPTAQSARVEVVSPAGLLPPDGLTFAVPAGGATRLERALEIGENAARINALNAGEVVAEITSGETPRRVPLRLEPLGLGARFRPGIYLLEDPPRLPLRLFQRGGSPRQGLVIGPAGSPSVAFRLGHGATLELAVPVSFGAGVGSTLLASEIDSGGERTFAAVVAQFSSAVDLPELPSNSGRLDAWLARGWQAIGLKAQVVAGGAGWSGPTDASLRWSAASDGEALMLALVWQDDQPTAGDRLELWLSRQPTGAGRAAVRRWSLWPADPDLTVWHEVVGDERLLELRLPWSLAGGRPAAGELIGFDLRLGDEDSEGGSELAYTGRRSDGTDSDQLALLRYGGGRIPPPARLWIDAPTEPN